jgi:hypothetical protein
VNYLFDQKYSQIKQLSRLFNVENQQKGGSRFEMKVRVLGKFHESYELGRRLFERGK